MAVTNSGFDGTVTEARFAEMMRGSGLRASVAKNAAWKVTAGAGRQVSIAPGIAYATGVVSSSDAAQLVSIPTPVNGQWHLVVRRVNWTSNTVTVETIPHSVTTTTVPTKQPATYPVYNDNEGVLLDHPLAWVWTSSVVASVNIWDLRVVSEDPRTSILMWPDAAARLAQTGMIEGTLGYQTDVGALWNYKQGAWSIGTGFVDLSSYIVAPLTGTLQACVRGGVVEVSGAISGASVPSSSSTTVLTNPIPEIYRPFGVNRWGSTWSYGYIGGLLVRPSGVVEVSQRTGATITTVWQFSFTYMVG